MVSRVENGTNESLCCVMLQHIKKLSFAESWSAFLSSNATKPQKHHTRNAATQYEELIQLGQVKSKEGTPAVPATSFNAFFKVFQDFLNK